MTPNSCPALLLNADYRPISVYPLETLHWQEAVRDSFLGRVSVLDEHDLEVRSPGFSMRLPSVVVLKVYQRQDRPAAMTRIGIFVRDKGRCAYCERKLTLGDLTFDHVVPRSKGGPTVWTNVVGACGPCNLRKADRRLMDSGMHLKRKPWVPTRGHLNEIALRDFPPRSHGLHKSWLPWLGIPESETDQVARVSVGPTSEAVFPADMSADRYWNVDLDE
jgi:5-methylcytosine-specific restriction endonuclease McrA